MDENEKDTARSFVAICYHNKSIGVACFDELTNTIFADCINVSTGLTFHTCNKKLFGGSNYN